LFKQTGCDKVSSQKRNSFELLKNVFNFQKVLDSKFIFNIFGSVSFKAAINEKVCKILQNLFKYILLQMF